MFARIGIIGDVHTEADALASAIELFQRLKVDQIVCMGDLVDGPCDELDVDRSCELLQEHGIPTVCGNHDRWILERSMRDLPDASSESELDPASLDFLRKLPPTVELPTPIGPVLLCHGLGDDDMALVLPHDHGHELTQNQPLQRLVQSGKYAVVLNGHSHRRMVRYVEPVWIINAGTLHRDNHPCVGCVDFETRTVDFYTVDGERIESASFE